MDESGGEDPGGKTHLTMAGGVQSFAFLLTGVATGLLGATLPVLLEQWSMNDRTGGWLLLLAWGGSTCGALLCRGNLRHIAAAGLMLTSFAMLTIAVVDREAVLPVFAFYGIGVGLAMTAITIMAAHSTSQTGRNQVMMRLNLLWSIGACLAPTLATHALRFTRAGGLFLGVGITFCAAALLLLASPFGPPVSLRDNGDPSRRLRAAPLVLYAMAWLAVGVESAIGGWLTTYSGRTAHSDAMTISATTGFWAGLLLSRALHTVADFAWLRKPATFTLHAALALLAAAGLLAAPHTAWFLPCALLAGFGLGPLYPRVLATVVGSYKSRAVFIVAGVGSAMLPWMTGALSHAAGSLTKGLLVPCVGAACLTMLMLLQRPAASEL